MVSSSRGIPDPRGPCSSGPVSTCSTRPATRVADVLVSDVLHPVRSAHCLQVEPGENHRQPRPRLVPGRAEVISSSQSSPSPPVLVGVRSAGPASRSAAVARHRAVPASAQRQHPAGRTAPLQSPSGIPSSTGQPGHDPSRGAVTARNRAPRRRPSSAIQLRRTRSTAPRPKSSQGRTTAAATSRNLPALHVSSCRLVAAIRALRPVLPGGEDGARVLQVLAVVQHQQQLLPQVLQNVSRQARRVIRQAQ